MAEPYIDPHREETFDEEVRWSPILWTMGGLTVVIIISMILMWWLSGGLKKHSIANDPTPSPIPEANERQLPPGPRLQASPEVELIEMQRENAELLNSYGWVDENAGVAHIPVERAIELIAERGLPTASDLAAGAAGAQQRFVIDGEVIEEESLDDSEGDS